MNNRANVHVKKWPRKNLGEVIDFLERVNPEGVSLQTLADKFGVTRGSISNMFSKDDMKLSKAESIANGYGYELKLFFPRRIHKDGFVPPEPKREFPNAANLSGLVKYIHDSDYSFSWVGEVNGISANVLTRAFEKGDISIRTLKKIIDNLGLCVIWSFEPRKEKEN